MSSSLSAPPDGDTNRANELNAVAWTWIALSSVVVALRFYTRIRLTKNLSWDDWFILITLVITAIYTSLFTYLGALGGCRHLYYLEKNPAQAIKAIRINWIAQPFTIIALATGKISIAFLIMRIMGKSIWRRAFLIWAVMIGSTLFCSITIILTFVQCKPVEALWNPALVPAGKAVCWPSYRQTDFSLFTGSWLAFIDLSLAIIPISIIWNLQLNWHKKLGLSALMGMGVFACICAAIKTSKLTELNARADITFITVDLWIWNANESNVVILAACMPTLRPLFLVLFRRPGSENYRAKSYGRSSHAGKWKLSRTSGAVGVSDSTTAVGAIGGNDSWLELGPNQRNNKISRTIELDVTSYPKPMDIDEEHTPTHPAGHTV